MCYGESKTRPLGINFKKTKQKTCEYCRAYINLDRHPVKFRELIPDGSGILLQTGNILTKSYLWSKMILYIQMHVHVY